MSSSERRSARRWFNARLLGGEPRKPLWFHVGEAFLITVAPWLPFYALFWRARRRHHAARLRDALTGGRGVTSPPSPSPVPPLSGLDPAVSRAGHSSVTEPIVGGVVIPPDSAAFLRFDAGATAPRTAPAAAIPPDCIASPPLR